MNPYARTFEGHHVTSTATAPTPAPVEQEDSYHEDMGPELEEGHEEAWEDGSGGAQYWNAGYVPPSFGYHHPQDFDYNHQANNGGVLVAGGTPAPPRDGWAELRRVYEDRAAVTAMEFDPFEELLWAGHSDGRLTSYQQPDMTKHSSIAAHKHQPTSATRRRAHHRCGTGTAEGGVPCRTVPSFSLKGEPKGPDGSIHALALLHDGVLSVSTSAVRLHTRGCLPRATFSGLVGTPGMRGTPPATQMIENLTCCALNTPSAAMGMGAPSASHVTVGTLGRQGGRGPAGIFGSDLPPQLLQLDPLSGLQLVKIVELPEEAGVTAMTRGTMLAVGGNDGNIRLLDPRLRSTAVEHLLTAHTGPVQALAVTPTDGLKMVSVGMKSKSLNPYDTSAPIELFADPVVRVFDARMPGRASPPLQFSMLGAPRLVRFLADESLVLASSTGQFLLSKEPFTETPRLDFFHVTDAQGAGEGLTCIAVSSSGDGIALGSASGACIQMGEGGRDIRSNLSSRPIEGPERPAPPPEVYVHPLDEAGAASKYIVRQTSKAAHRTGSLSSSFASTPKLLRAVLRRPPPRRPATELLEKATWRDYLGVIPNPGHEPNSLLFGKGKAAYEVVDPRRRKDKDAHVFERRSRGSLGGTTAAMRAMGLEDVPRRYRRPVIHLGRRGFDGFDFARYNTTEYAGLENAHAHAYVNSILQALFFVPEVREAALREQYNPIHYAFMSSRTTSGLSCELGFLFHQLERAREMDPKNRSCQATNFLRAFKEVPEVLALGLLEDPQNKRAISLPRKVEAFHRFLLSQLDKEAKEPDIPPALLAHHTAPPSKQKDSKGKRGKAKGAAAAGAIPSSTLFEAEAADAEGAAGRSRSTVDGLYGYGTRTSNVFLADKKAAVDIDVKHTRTLVTEMIPVDHPGHSVPAKYFADVLARSLCRETRARAWREEIGAYAPIKQKRCPVSLPEVMPIHCAAALESSDATKEAFRSKNCRGGPWLPREIEISLVEREDGELTVVVGEAADSPPRWMQKLEASERAEEASTTAGVTGPGTGENTAGDGNPSGNGGKFSTTENENGEAGKVRKGWYFASPLPGKDGATAVAAAARKGGGGKAVHSDCKEVETSDQRCEDGGASVSRRWLEESVVQYRYELLEVVSRVVPAANKKIDGGDGKRGGGAGTGAGGGGGKGGKGGGGSNAPSASASASGEAGKVAAEDGHLVLHVKAPVATPAPASTSNKDPPRSKNLPRRDSNGGSSSSSSSVSSARTGSSQSSGSTRGFKKTEGVGGKGDGNESGSGGVVVDDVRAMIGTRKDDGAVAAREKATEVKVLVEREGEGGREGEKGDEPFPGVDGKEEASFPEVMGRDEKRWEEALGDDHEEDEEDENWLLFNDFRVERTVLEDARGFDPTWKEPCVLVYRRVAPSSSSSDSRETAAAEVRVRRVLREHLAIPASVFDIPSLSKNRPVSQVVRLPPDRLPGKGDIVAIDAEFVSLMVEESRLRGDGSKVITKQGRQSLARVSVLDGRVSNSEATALVIMDDYVVQSEPVVDHLTRFSGITAEDLDPVTSRHNLHHLRTVYLRLRWLADAGCVFLGHGLDNDFRMFNLTLPPEQVIDTVNLWSLSGQRKISLRFLAHYLLGMNIQGETHDSIEDARIALALYNKYRSHVDAGTLSTALDTLYKYGWEVGWKLDGGLTA